MNAQQFLAEFRHIVHAPGGVQRLRELVLQLAISGRLVERRDSETPVSTSLAAASEQRKKYEDKLELRSTRPHPPVSEVPYAIPDHWQWARLEQLALYVQRGKSPKYADRGRVCVISQKCVQWAGFDIKQARRITDESIADYGKERFLCDGDLLWNSTGTGTAGRVAMYAAANREPGVADSHVTVVRLTHAAVPRYLWCVIASPWVQARIHPTHSDSLVSGTTQQVELATSTARALPIACPPVEEQLRIIARVDELMALCDALETQQHDRRKMQNDLRRSALLAVAASSSPYELQTTWARLESNFRSLFNAPEDVGELRKLVLDLAIGGLLTERNTDDESVAQFIARCHKGKAGRLVSGELKRKAVAATDVNQSEIVVPQHWEQLPLDELFQFIDYRGKTPAKTDSGVVLVTAKNVRPGRLNREPVEYISEKSYTEWMTRGFPRAGDILFTTEAPLGNVALIEDPPKFALAQRIIDLQPFADLNTRCSMYFMMSPAFQALLERNSTGMTAKGIKAGKLKQLELPVPPVEEQARIVERVNGLMHACDELEGKLSSATKVAERLAVAAVSALTGIAIEQQEDEPVKAPQTELVAPLCIGTPPGVKAQAPLATLLARQDGEMSARDLWQRFGGEVDAFYAQLKTEVAHGWILEPVVAEMREKSSEAAGA